MTKKMEFIRRMYCNGFYSQKSAENVKIAGQIKLLRPTKEINCKQSLPGLVLSVRNLYNKYPV